jgi:serine/threonine protein kinase
MDFPPDPQRTDDPGRGGLTIRRTTVLTRAPRVVPRDGQNEAEGGRGRDLASGLAVAGGAVALPGLRAEEKLLLGLVDGRLSVARLARLTGFSEEATAAHLRSLCDRRMLVPVETAEVTIHGNSGEPFFRLGPYEVASRLGQGGMGTVYVCRRTGAAGFRRLFALKVVRQGSGQEAAAEKSFLREIRVGVLLDHPNTQSLVDVGMYKHQPFLVLQYIEGTSLEEISFGRRVPPDVLLTILIDVLRGLQRAHEISDEQGRWLGLVHGDVSAPNILVGVDGVARLTDFGSARFTALGESGQGDPVTLGKPAYMAPEQLRLESLDARTDVFAMGAVMWTALTGQELFAADTHDQIVQNVLHKEIVPPSAFGAPGCLDGICLAALRRAREGRPASAAEMAQALLTVGVANDLVASPAAVGAYLRREVMDADVERRRRLDSAFQDAVAAPASGTAPTVTVASMPATSEKKYAKTLFIPDPTGRATGKASKTGTSKTWTTSWIKGRLADRRVLALVLGTALAIVAGVITMIAVHHRGSRHAAPGAGGGREEVHADLRQGVQDEPSVR